MSAAELFRRIAGREPDGVWSAPGRVNLIGEHTDYNEGFVLPFAIDRRTGAAVATRADGRSESRPRSRPPTGCRGPDRRPRRSRRRRRVARAAVGALSAGRHLGLPSDVAGHAGGLDIAIDSDVPVGAGLSSSAAIECAVAVALNELWHLGMTVSRSLASASSPRTRSSARRPASWISRPPCSPGRTRPSSSTAARSRPRSCRWPLAPRGSAFSSSTPGKPRARHRRLPRAARGVRAGRLVARRPRAARPGRRRPRPRARAARRRHLPARAPRRHRERARARHRRTPARRRPPRDRAAARRLARVDARRLRDLGAGTRPRGRGGPRRRCHRRPDDRRRIRRLRDRARRNKETRQVEATVRDAFRCNAFAEPDFFVVRPSDGAGRDA